MDIVTLGELGTRAHTSIEEIFLGWVFIVVIIIITITTMTNALNLDQANQKIFLNQDQIFLVQVQKMYLILAHPKAHLPGVKLIFLVQAPKIKDHHFIEGRNY